MEYVTKANLLAYLDRDRPPSAGWVRRSLPRLEAIIGVLKRDGLAGDGVETWFAAYDDDETHRLWLGIRGVRLNKVQRENVLRHLGDLIEVTSGVIEPTGASKV